MGDETNLALAVVDQQLQELEAIAKQTNDDLNAVAGQERVAKWKARTVAVLTQRVGPMVGQEFSRANPGPSFTNDLVDEFNDEVDFYRGRLKDMYKRLQTGATR
ncbi:MAG: hypothetical protein ABW047_15940 [Nitrospiraceae bacterium]